MDDLPSSNLGTLTYWNKCYNKELNNFNNHGDPGEVWFGDDIVNRIIQWMQTSELVKKDSRLVDVGCGNGLFLIDLANAGFTNLYGIDYSHKAIELAKTVAGKANVNIIFFMHDILVGLETRYDIIHDKGTFDAISLTENAVINKNTYIDSVYCGLNDDGLFIITSCNWTESELEFQFKEKFKKIYVIPTPQFKFGGKVGSVVSSCIFQKIVL